VNAREDQEVVVVNVLAGEGALVVNVQGPDD